MHHQVIIMQNSDPKQFIEKDAWGKIQEENAKKQFNTAKCIMCEDEMQYELYCDKCAPEPMREEYEFADCEFVEKDTLRIIISRFVVDFGLWLRGV